MKYLIVGLGNIGAEYHNTRHNIGFMVLDELAKKYEATFEQDRHSFSCQVKYKGRQLHLVKPTTFMNLSGKAVAYFLQHLKIPKENLLVIVDDLATYDYGKFIHIMDPEGNKIELWEPVDSVLSKMGRMTNK